MTRAPWAAAASMALALAASPSRGAAEDARELSPPRAPDEPSGEPEFSLDLAADATLPLAVGGRVALEVPGHFVFHVTAGVVAAALVDAINDVGTGWGMWNELDARVYRSLLGDATWLEIGVGLRPAGTPGIELSVGYAVLWSHRILDAAAVGAPYGPAAVGLDVTIDAVHAELAWQTALLDHISFRVALGWAHAVNHRVSIVTDTSDDAVRGALAQTEAQLSDEVGRRAFGPTLGVALGIRLY